MSPVDVAFMCGAAVGICATLSGQGFLIALSTRFAGVVLRWAIRQVQAAMRGGI